MKQEWYKTFMAHSQTEEFKKKIEEAKRIIENAIHKYKKPYIAFSGGKDSLCVLHLISNLKKDIMVFHWDYGRFYIPEKMEKCIRIIPKIFGMKNIYIDSSKKYLNRDQQPVFYKSFFGKVIPKLINEGYDCCFLGLRKEESSQRKIRIENNINLSSIQEIYPIQNWAWLDVWSYIVANDLPYLKYYDIYGEVIGYEKVRFSTLFDPEFDKFGNNNIDKMLMWREYGK